MRGLILAGGKGTRLRPLTVYTPKPAVPLANRPFLLYQIENFKNAGIGKITLSLSYQPQKIEQIVGDGSEFGVNLDFLTEPRPMGTAGAYRFAADSKGETMIVFNGDILTDFEISEMIEFHRKTGSKATIALVSVEDPARYGLVEKSRDGHIGRFLEKPTPEQIAESAANTINAGIYILEPDVLKLIPKGENSSFEYQIFPQILQSGIPFYGFDIGESYWIDIGTPGNYLRANQDLLAGRVGLSAVERPAAAEVSQTTSVDNLSVIAADCVIKPNSRITNSVLGAGVHVEEKAVIENSVVWPHTRISGGAIVSDAIIGRGCYIGKNAVVRNGSVLGDKASVPDYSVV